LQLQPLADGRVLLLRAARCCHQPRRATAGHASFQFPVPRPGSLCPVHLRQAPL